VLVFSLGVVLETAEAAKSAGNPLTEIGSKKICGDKLCAAPLSIEEKIAAFLESKRIHEGGVEQQIGRFSEGGVSQQAFQDKSKFIADGTYVNDVLGFSINPHSFSNGNDLAKKSSKGAVMFTSNKMDYQNFPPYFTVMAMGDKELIVPYGSSFENEFITKYTDGLKSTGSISTVDITVKYGGKFW